MIVKKDELRKKFENIENLLEEGKDFDSVMKEIKNLDDSVNEKKFEFMEKAYLGQTTTQIIDNLLKLGELSNAYKQGLDKLENKYGFSIKDVLNGYSTANTTNMYG